MSTETVKGTVTTWTQKGFGFIKDAEEKEHFVHHSNIKVAEGAYSGLTQGEEVEFTIAPGQNGKTRAENVTAVGGGALPGTEKPQEQSFGGGRGGGRGGDRGGRGFGGGGRGGGRGFGCGRGRGGY